MPNLKTFRFRIPEDCAILPLVVTDIPHSNREHSIKSSSTHTFRGFNSISRIWLLWKAVATNIGNMSCTNNGNCEAIVGTALGGDAFKFSQSQIALFMPSFCLSVPTCFRRSRQRNV